MGGRGESKKREAIITSLHFNVSLSLWRVAVLGIDRWPPSWRGEGEWMAGRLAGPDYLVV